MTILFAALTSLLRCFADQKRALNRLAENNPPTQQLVDQLRRDLTNARSVRSEPRSLTLVGNLAQDWETRSPTGRRAEVTYLIKTIASESWLIRREVHLDGTSSQRRRDEPIWRGATRIELIANSEASSDSTMPTRMRLVLHRENAKPLVELNVVHHWEDS